MNPRAPRLPARTAGWQRRGMVPENDRLPATDGGHSGKRTARGVQRRRVCRGHNPAGPEPGHRRPGSAPADAGREASRSLAGRRCLCRQLCRRRDHLGQPPRTVQEHLRDRPDALVRQPPVAVLRRLHPVRHRYHRRLPARRHRRCVAGRGAVSRRARGHVDLLHADVLVGYPARPPEGRALRAGRPAGHDPVRPRQPDLHRGHRHRVRQRAGLAALVGLVAVYYIFEQTPVRPQASREQGGPGTAAGASPIRSGPDDNSGQGQG